MHVRPVTVAILVLALLGVGRHAQDRQPTSGNPLPVVGRSLVATTLGILAAITRITRNTN